MRNYDSWLQDSGAYERFSGCDELTEEEQDARDRRIEYEIDEAEERLYATHRTTQTRRRLTPTPKDPPPGGAGDGVPGAARG